MKKLSKITLILLSILSFYSCSNDETVQEQTYVYKSEKLNFTKFFNNQVGVQSREPSDFTNYIHSEFETTFFIPDDLTNEELREYITENQSSIDGTLRYFFNDKEFITVKFVKGQIVGNINVQSKAYPCTYDGIQDCVQYAVYEEWTTIEALICAATGGLECIAVEAAACIEQNCF